MIGVQRVVVRSQHVVEVPAGRIVRRLQKAAFGRVGLPMPADGDTPSVGEDEAGDIDGIGGGVLTA